MSAYVPHELPPTNFPHGDTFSILATATIFTAGEMYYFFSQLTRSIDRAINGALEDVAESVSCRVLGEITVQVPAYAKYIADGAQSLSSDEKTKLLAEMVGKCDDIDDCMRQQFTTEIYDAQQKWITALETISEREQVLVDKINTYTKVTGALIVGALLVLLVTFGIKHKRRITRWDFLSSIVSICVIGMFQWRFIKMGEVYNMTSDNQLTVDIVKLLLESDEPKK